MSHRFNSEIVEHVKSIVTQNVVDEYQRDGAVCIRQILTQDEIDLLKSGIDRNLKHPSSRVKIASKPDDTGLFTEDFCNWQNNEYYKKFIFESSISIVAGLLMRSKTTRLYHDHMLVKEANTKQITPWHQDQPYYNIDGFQNCSIWIPVDPVSRYSTVEFIAGSHHGKWLMPRTFMDNKAKWFPEGTLEDLPDIENEREKYPIIGWELEPRDIVCFHMLTLHGARGADQRRRAFSVRFLGDDITHAPRTWKTSPEFEELSNELAVRAKMNHSLFPILWEQ
ncbi:unnamed protein product [Didymodactylos carnosus]|uniref:Phytanoyl-CoA dioxygenase n=1 Tax=Didymodactylos carnosus TaxID=1234261 RepID=A0A814F0H1_9BILA|nr:unnamed protein product [Didymodactylos carnosus]CAF3752026.1 unnamed protein product [Didymodactylos carnosus]